MGWTNRWAVAVAGLALAALAALPASAAPLRVWLNTDGVGFAGSSITAARNAGMGGLPASSFFGNSGGTRISVTTPSPIPGVSRKKATKSNPSTGQSTWTVTAVDRDYQDLWIVIQGHSPNDANAKYYKKHGNIGLIVDPSDPSWKTVSPSGTPGVTYLAYFVGDLLRGDGFDVPISYAVAKALKRISKDPSFCVFPQYRVNFLELEIGRVPEPVVLSLLAFGGTLLAIRKRRPLG
jgi:hypothetical protein